MNIILDLDGTLIDSRRRLYSLFQQLVPESKLAFEAYWDLKFNKHSNFDILVGLLGMRDARVKLFQTQWMKLIESHELLQLDECMPGLHKKLLALSKEASLHVCTARQFYQPVTNQLDRFGLLQFFDKILVTHQVFSKVDLISQHLELSPIDWIIGDTGHDIQTGRRLGINTCAVLSGFMNKKNLEAYEPDLILGSIVDFQL